LDSHTVSVNTDEDEEFLHIEDINEDPDEEELP
jgi:hypothetical protein